MSEDCHNPDGSYPGQRPAIDWTKLFSERASGKMLADSVALANRLQKELDGAYGLVERIIALRMVYQGLRAECPELIAFAEQIADKFSRSI